MFPQWRVLRFKIIILILSWNIGLPGSVLGWLAACWADWQPVGLTGSVLDIALQEPSSSSEKAPLLLRDLFCLWEHSSPSESPPLPSRALLSLRELSSSSERHSPYLRVHIWPLLLHSGDGSLDPLTQVTRVTRVRTWNDLTAIHQWRTSEVKSLIRRTLMILVSFEIIVTLFVNTTVFFN